MVAHFPVYNDLPLFPYLSPCHCTAGPASESLHTGYLCSRESGGSGKGGLEDSSHDDPTVPLIRQNVYAWYLAVSERS